MTRETTKGNDPEITKADLASWSNREIALALIGVAIGSTDRECARICREASDRLRQLPELPK